MMLGQFATASRPSPGQPDNLVLLARDIAAMEKLIAETTERWDTALAQGTMRIRELSEKAESIREDKLQSVLKSLRDGHGKELAQRGPEKEFRPTTGVPKRVSDVFKNEGRSNEINALRAACRPPPDFSRLAEIVPAYNCNKKFSDPEFFYQEWERTEIEKIDENERKQREEKEAKKRDREKRKRELADGAGGSNRALPQEEQKIGEARPSRPPRQPSNIPADSPSVQPPIVARRSSRPLSVAVSSSTVAGAVAPPPRPARADMAPPQGEAMRRSSVALPTQSSSQSLIAGQAAPVPLARPSRPRTVAIPPSQQPQPMVNSAASPSIGTAAPPPAPPAPLPRPVPAPVVEPPARLPSPRKAPPPPIAAFSAHAELAPAAVSPAPQPNLISAPLENPVGEEEHAIPQEPSAQQQPTRPARRPRPPPPPVTAAVEQPQPARPPPPAIEKTAPETNARPKRPQEIPPAAPAAAPAFEYEPPPMKKQPSAAPAFSPPRPIISEPAPEVNEGYQLEEAEPVQEPTAPVGLSDDPALKKYVMMQKMNLPQGAIEQAMIRDKVDPSLLFGASAMSSLNAAPVKIAIPAKSSGIIPRAEPSPAPSGNALMDEILKGRSLRKVETPPSPSEASSGGGGGIGSDLMQGIMEGRGKLKKVEQPPVAAKKALPSALDGGGVASILARRIAIIGEKGSDTDSAGSEWDDSDED